MKSLPKRKDPGIKSANPTRPGRKMSKKLPRLR
jgi:hypothetical protein